jgi:hypothetical protein
MALQCVTCGERFRQHSRQIVNKRVCLSYKDLALLGQPRFKGYVETDSPYKFDCAKQTVIGFQETSPPWSEYLTQETAAGSRSMLRFVLRRYTYYLPYSANLIWMANKSVCNIHLIAEYDLG